MAVMSKMRDYTKVFLIILVLAFIGTIVFDWGMDLTGLRSQTGAIAKVNGKTISWETFYRTYEQEIDNYRERNGNEPSESQLNFIRNQVWDNLVREELVSQEISKRDIRPTDKEIIFYLFDHPPDIIRQNPSFQTENGQFDFAKYQAALNDPNAKQFWAQVENYLRASLPFQKFQDVIDASVLVTESQVRDEYLKRNQKVNVRYVLFPIESQLQSLDSVATEELEDYYEDHQDEFKEEEKRAIDYVIYSSKATAKDSQAVRELAQDLYSRAVAGEDFAEMAKTYSEDPSNRDGGGDLNFFKRGQMVKPFEEAAFNAKVGEVVGPVETSFGLHVIKVVDRKTENNEEMVRASHVLLKFDASAETVAAARDSANYLSSRAKEASWQEAVKGEAVAAQTSNPFVEGNGFVPGVGVNASVSRFVFKNKVGSVSEPFDVPQGFVVVRVAKMEEPHTKSLADVKSQIENTVKREKAKQKAQQAAEKLYAELVQSGAQSLDSLARRENLEVKSPEPFNRSSFVTGVGRDPDFIGAAFALKSGEFSKPIKGNRGSYVLQFVSLDQFDEADYASKKDAVRTQLIDKAKQDAFTQWYAAVKEEAKIEDYRDLYF